MSRPPLRYADRAQAGEVLATELAGRGYTDPVVVGLARGGVEVAAVVAERLGCELDALAVSKVGHPLQPEFALGAVTSTVTYIRPGVPIPRGDLDRAVAAARQRTWDLDRRIHADLPGVSIARRGCVLVDDGLATGATMVASARWARAAGATSVVVAVPVAPAVSLEELLTEADDVVCPRPVRDLRAVGLWYDDFDQVDEDRVRQLLRVARERPARVGGGPVA